VSGYPDGARPTSTVSLGGGDAAGAGENVGWTSAAHARFAAACASVPLRGERTLGELSAELVRAFGDPYDRAAVEAAAMELALAQNRVDLATLARAPPRPVRYVVSFDARSLPVPRMREERRRSPTAEFKLDVDPRWSDGELDRIAAEGGVAVLDFKGAGDAADHARFAARFPSALLEDALARETGGCAALRDRLSFDAPIVSAEALAAIDPPPAAVNVKPARMGGVLEAIAALAIAARHRSCAYFGGMFEVGVGRRQLCALASVLCPDGPNDIAPLVPPERPVRLDPRGASGFSAPPLPELTLSRPDDPRSAGLRSESARGGDRREPP